MSRLFQEDGDSIPVTLISVFGNYIADIKTEDRDGYSSVVVLKQSNNKRYFKKSHMLKSSAKNKFSAKIVLLKKLTNGPDTKCRSIRPTYCVCY